MTTLTKAQEAKVAEAREEGLAFLWARTTAGAFQCVGVSWEDVGFHTDDAGNPITDSRGNTVLLSGVERLDPANATHVALCEEWWG